VVLVICLPFAGLSSSPADKGDGHFFLGFHNTTVQCMAMRGHPPVGTLPYQFLLMHRYRIVHPLAFYGKLSYALTWQFCYLY
jgi:hypothetical protein